jgi:ABC-type multidrug transport system ATPase subunit
VAGGLELRNVSKVYSGTTAVENVSFAAGAGEVIGYLGANGSGKSTTFKMIAGLIEPTYGEILFQDRPIERDRIAHRQRLGYVPEEPQLYPHLTGFEYLEMVGQLRGLPERRLAEKDKRLSTPALALPGPLRCHFFLLERDAPESAAGCRAAAQSQYSSAG